MGILKINLYQKSIESRLDISNFKRLINLKSHFLLLPEYFHVSDSVKDYGALAAKDSATEEWLLKLSQGCKGIVIGGSLVRKIEQGKGEGSRISTPIIYGGELVDWYDKRWLSPQEQQVAQPGEGAGIFSVAHQRFAVLSGDEFKRPDYFQEIVDQKIRLLFLISNSTDPKGREQENRQILSVASQHNLHIVRCCSAGSLFGTRLYGRSLVASSMGISWQGSPEEEGREIVKTLMVSVVGTAPTAPLPYTAPIP